MKKNYILTLLIAFFFSVASFGQDLLITGIIDGPLPGGFPKGIELYVVNDIADISIYGLESTTNGAAAAGAEFTFPADAYTAGTFIYVGHTNGGTTDNAAAFTQYLGVTVTYQDGVMSHNGNDTIILYKNGTVVDSVGEIGVNGTGTAWESKDGWGYRKDGMAQNATFDANEWTFSGPDALDGCDNANGGTDNGTNAECSSVFPVGTYSATASTNPSISISSPANNATIAATTSVNVSVAVANFTVGAVGGAGVDGHIHWTVQKNSDATVAQPMKYNTNDETITVTAGNSYTVTMELVDNSHNPIMPSVSASTMFTVAMPCDLLIGTITETCDALTSGVDTYNTTIDFTGGNTGAAYTITADSGTVGGDNPNTTPSGTITVTGISEGTNVALTIVGDATSSCNYSRTLYSPTCVAFPIVETFDYAVGTDLTDAANWSTTSSSTDKVQVVAATIANPFAAGQYPDPTGNMVSFAGGGADPAILFNEQSSGTVYTSFLFTPTDMTGINATGGYFAVLQEAGGSYKARLWVRPDATDATKYNVGISGGSSASNYHTFVYTPGEPNFIVMAYDFATNDIKVWIDADPTSFEAASAPTATLTETGGTANNLGRFLLRQDSNSETPPINFDELRIGTTWKQVTPKTATASIGEDLIDGFAVYPNPVSNKRFTVATASTTLKEVKVFNVLGKQVFSEEFTGISKQFDVATINSGIYILKVVEGTKVVTKKLVIK